MAEKKDPANPDEEKYSSVRIPKSSVIAPPEAQGIRNFDDFINFLKREYANPKYEGDWCTVVVKTDRPLAHFSLEFSRIYPDKIKFEYTDKSKIKVKVSWLKSIVE